MKRNTQAQIDGKRSARKAYNQNRKCDGCGEKILTRPYVEPTDGIMHEACWNKTFV